MTPSLRRYKTRPAHLLTGHTGTKLAQHRPFIGTSGTKLAQHTKKRQFWALFRLQGEYSHARGSPKQSRAKIVTHRARKHERLERKIAPARGAKGRRETFFAHARSQEPFLAHFNRAGAIFLSLRMHAKHWSNPLGRYFFQDQTKPTEPPILTRRNRHQQPGGADVMRAEGLGGHSTAAVRAAEPESTRAPSPTRLEATAWPAGAAGPGQHRKRRRCGGRRRVRRARAGFEARRRTK